MWYFGILINENISNYIHKGDSNKCLSGSSCSCNPAFKLGSVVGCINEIIDTTKNSDGESCSHSKCIGGVLNECVCDSQSCGFNVKNYCKCPDSNPGNVCVCLDGKSCCNPGCSRCEGANLCSKCIDENAEVEKDSRCYCKKGFYGNNPLENNDICAPCNKNCSECSDYYNCTKCKYSKFYLKDGICESCHPDCISCKSNLTCTRCIDKFSIGSNFGCNCVQGYWKKQLIGSYSCEKCSDDCSECKTKASA